MPALSCACFSCVCALVCVCFHKFVLICVPSRMCSWMQMCLYSYYCNVFVLILVQGVCFFCRIMLWAFLGRQSRRALLGQRRPCGSSLPQSSFDQKNGFVHFSNLEHATANGKWVRYSRKPTMWRTTVWYWRYCGLCDSLGRCGACPGRARGHGAAHCVTIRHCLIPETCFAPNPYNPDA